MFATGWSVRLDVPKGPERPSSILVAGNDFSLAAIILAVELRNFPEGVRVWMYDLLLCTSLLLCLRLFLFFFFPPLHIRLSQTILSKYLGKWRRMDKETPFFGIISLPSGRRTPREGQGSTSMPNAKPARPKTVSAVQFKDQLRQLWSYDFNMHPDPTQRWRCFLLAFILFFLFPSLSLCCYSFHCV